MKGYFSAGAFVRTDGELVIQDPKGVAKATPIKGVVKKAAEKKQQPAKKAASKKSSKK